MADTPFKIGDLVWAKMKTYPYWPAKIVDPPPKIKLNNLRKVQHCVRFFGTNDHGLISEECIAHHSDEMVLNSKKGSKKMSFALKRAIDEIINISKNTCDNDSSPINGELDNNETEEEMSPQMIEKNDGDESDFEMKHVIKDELEDDYEQEEDDIEKDEDDIEKDEGEREETNIEEGSSNELGNSYLSKSSSEESIAIAVNREIEEINSESSQHSVITEKNASKVKKKFGLSQKRKREKPNKSRKRRCSSPEKAVMMEDLPSPSTDLPFSDSVSPLLKAAYIERPPTPALEVMKVSDFLNAKDISPTDKKIGFLGLGMIGQGVVKNLLHSGHKVTVWNRNLAKCEPFVKAGALKVLTPADVVASCDITFCCISDSMAVKTVVFESCGVLKGFEGCTAGTKGYVEMTSIDPVTSSEISKSIANLGGRYLEAPVIGSRQLADEGALLSLVAGDRELFNDCYSCFFAFTRNVYFLSNTVGYGSKMKLIQSMLYGTTAAALAEALALVEHCKLPQHKFLEILSMSPLSCPLVREKGSAMAERNFTTDTALKHQLKDLSLVLQLSDTYQQYTATTSSANQLFKIARILNYSDHDVSAVIMGAQ